MTKGTIRLSRPAVAVFFTLASVFAVSAIDIDLSAQAGASTETINPVSGAFTGRFDAGIGGFDVFGEMSIENSGIYGGLFGGAYGYGGLSIVLGEAGIRYESGPLTLGAGRMGLRDIVDSPYSLFVSSRGNVALGSVLAYEDDTFFYSSSWVALNYDLSDRDIPDRSAVIKSYGLKLGSFRVAFQDAAVMTSALPSPGFTPDRGPLFDAEYFLLPLPSIFLQYVATSQDSPWRKDGSFNDNSIMGFMADWREGPWYAVGQILIDDINMNRFIDPDGVFNPDKIAWQLGSSWDGPYGSFGFYHAGATKYTFQPYGSTGSNTQYGYTLYPFTSYTVNGMPMALEPEANYLGYLHGENNLAFMATWNHELKGATLAAALEFTLSGSKSPANPWHEFNDFTEDGEGTKFLDDAVLEKKALLTMSAAYPLGDWEFGLEVALGYVWNRLKLGASPSSDSWNDIPFYSPSDENAVMAAITIGGRYRLSL